MFPGLKLPPKEGSINEAAEIETPEVEIAEGEVEQTGPINITPEAVCYRDESMVCGNCQYMGADGNCSALKMTVSPGDGCNLFADRGAM